MPLWTTSWKYMSTTKTSRPPLNAASLEMADVNICQLTADLLGASDKPEIMQSQVSKARERPRTCQTFEQPETAGEVYRVPDPWSDAHIAHYLNFEHQLGK